MKKANCLKKIVKTLTNYDIPDTKPTVAKCLATLISKIGGEDAPETLGKTNCELLHDLDSVIPNYINVVNASATERLGVIQHSIVELSFPNTTTIIKSRWFYGFSNIKKVTVPATVTEIQGGAFQNCGNIEELVLNEGLQKIGDTAFAGDTKITNVEMPSTITNLGRKYICKYRTRNYNFQRIYTTNNYKSI